MAFYQDLVSILDDKSVAIDEIVELVREAIVAGKCDMTAEEVLKDATTFATAFSRGVQIEQEKYINGRPWYVNVYSSQQISIPTGTHLETACKIDGSSRDIKTIIGPVASHFTTGDVGCKKAMWLTQIVAEHGPEFCQLRMIGAPSKGMNAFLKALVEKMGFSFVQLLAPDRKTVWAVCGCYTDYYYNGLKSTGMPAVRLKKGSSVSRGVRGPVLWNIDCSPSRFFEMIAE